VLEAIQTRRLNGQNVIHDIQVIAETTEEVMGGTSGSLYSIFFSGLAVALRSAASAGTETVTPEIWAGAARQALVNLYKCESALAADFVTVINGQGHVRHSRKTTKQNPS
jgi:dihydroxyacetone kinase